MKTKNAGRGFQTGPAFLCHMLSGTVIFSRVSALEMTFFVAVHSAMRAWQTQCSASFTRQEL